MSAKDDYTIALNILARVGLNGDLIGEFSKAKAGLNMMNSMNQLQAQQMTQAPPTPPMPPTGQQMPQEPQIASNQGMPPQEQQMV